MHAFNHANENSVSLECCQRLSCMAGLANGLIHELHNSLGALRSNANALQLKKVKQNEQHFGYMQDALARTHFLTEILRLYTRDSLVCIQTVKILPIIEDALRSIQATPEFQNIECIWKHSPVRQHAVRTNQDLLHKAIYALLQNACESLGPQKRQVILSLKENDQDVYHSGKMTMGCHVTGCSYLQVTIEDKGCGIPDGDIPCIFDPFYTTKMRAKGLGLAYVVGLVQKTNALLTCHTSLQKGTAFTLSLPMES